MKTRTDLLNFLAEKYNLQRYLEIGVQVPELNFDKIKCADKIGVDPDPKANATFGMDSDNFFNMWLSFEYEKIAIPSRQGMEPDFADDNTDLMHLLCRPRFSQQVYSRQRDLIFIDGLHTAEQVKKDFENALKILSPNGFIVLHDCNPEKEEHTIVPRPSARGHWNGDVYKFACQLATNWLSYKTIDIDNGCGIFTPNTQRYSLGEIPAWGHFDKNRKELLNLITWEDFVKL
jgi:hypothetical protein